MVSVAGVNLTLLQLVKRPSEQFMLNKIPRKKRRAHLVEEKSPKVKYWHQESQQYLPCDIVDTYSHDVYVVVFNCPQTAKHITRMCFKRELEFNASV